MGIERERKPALRVAEQLLVERGSSGAQRGEDRVGKRHALKAEIREEDRERREQGRESRAQTLGALAREEQAEEDERGRLQRRDRPRAAGPERERSEDEQRSQEE